MILLPTYTHESFESTSWHDNYVHAIRFVEGPDGAGEFHLYLDHILEWMDGDAHSFRFKVAPAHLRFVGVMSLRIHLDYSSTAMGPFQIDGIERRNEKKERYTATIWTIQATYPAGEIEFEASGYIQDLLAPPIEVDRQWLTPAERGDI
jgi:hypothetical protein